MGKPVRKKDLTFFLCGSYGLFLVFWIWRLWSRFPAVMDWLEYVFPEKWFNVESFQKGLFPLWNPYIACGTPHLASFQPAVFYPLFWLWNLTGLTHWFFILSLAHVLLAAAGFYLWLRALKVSKEGALLGALSWSGSAYLTLLWTFPTHLASLTWIPWVFAASEKLKERCTWGRWFVLVGLWCLQVLAGYPIFTFYAVLFWSTYLLFTFKKNKGPAFSALAAALVLSMCQWLPFVEFLTYMHRDVDSSNLYNLKWSEYLTLFSPNILGTPGAADYKGEYGNFIFGNFYLGVVPLLLVLWSLVRGKENWGFWHKSLVFTLFLPMGVHLVPGQWSDGFIDKLEISKASFLFVFAALTFAALNLEKFRAEPFGKNVFRRWGWILLVLWAADLLSVSLRVVHPVADPYQDPQVREVAQQVKKAAGDDRVVSLRMDKDIYSAAVTDYASSVRETAERMTQNSNVVWGIRSVQGHLTSVVDGYQNVAGYIRGGYPYDGRVLDAAGAGLFIASSSLGPFKYKVGQPFEGWNLIRNAGAMPQEWTVDKQSCWPDRAACIGSLLDPKCFLENEVRFDQSGLGGTTQLASTTRIPAVIADSPCDHVYHVAPGSSTALVLSETFAPGWHAWVDDQPTAIQRADGFWMAVLLVPGVTHQVLFQYGPVSVRLGFFMSLISLGALLFLALTKIPQKGSTPDRLVLKSRTSKRART